MRLILIVLFVGEFSLAVCAQDTRHIFPQATHPNIAQTLRPHAIIFDAEQSTRNQLFVFFPGTGGQPLNYDEILRTAADLGYHTIGLSYINARSMTGICRTSTDTTCHSRGRLEVINGEDLHDDLQVDSFNSIKHRLIALLKYLEDEYPEENWDQFLSDHTIDWQQIVVAGHSQGGGHAAIIGKLHEVQRVVMFASVDWIPLLNRNADWVTWEGLTPPDRYFGFIHRHDELVNFLAQQISWNNLGMQQGNLVLIDTSAPPYQSAQTLITEITPAVNPSKFHNCVAVDLFTPLDNNGIPVLQPVWRYLFNDPQLVNVSRSSRDSDLHLWPNPTSRLVHMTSSKRIIAYQILTPWGHLLSRYYHNEILDLAGINPGPLLLYVIYADGRRESRILILR